jgi:hypothetical protein
MKQVNLRLSEETLAAIDDARGQVPREPWIRNVLADRLAELAPRVFTGEIGFPPGVHPPRSTWPEGWREQPLIVQGVTTITPDGHRITIVNDPVKPERVEPSVPPSLPVKRPRKGPLAEKEYPVNPAADPHRFHQESPKPGYVRNTPAPAPKLGELPSAGPKLAAVPDTHPFKAQPAPRQMKCATCGHGLNDPRHDS